MSTQIFASCEQLSSQHQYDEGRLCLRSTRDGAQHVVARDYKGEEMAASKTEEPDHNDYFKRDTIS